MLVRSVRLGEALASCFSGWKPSGDGHLDGPDHSVVLMRGHGFTVMGSGVEECVFRAVYTKENAIMQTSRLTLNAAHHRGSEMAQDVEYLSEEEMSATMAMTRWAWTRAWGLWVREVEAAGLYVNYV